MAIKTEATLPAAEAKHEGSCTYKAAKHTPQASDNESAQKADQGPTDAELDEAVERLLSSGMKQHKNTLLAILDFCRDPRTADEVSAFVDSRQAENVSVYDSATFCRNLEKAGAMEEIRQEGQERDEEVIVEGNAYVKPGDPATVRFVTTPAGSRALKRYAPADRLAKLVADNSQYEPIYLQLLSMCDEDEGTTPKAMGQAVDDDPLLQDPKLYAQHFFNQLYHVNAIEWRNKAWHTTTSGHAFVEEHL
jgi:hypothetical protein